MKPGKCVYITGGSSGIGLALAQAYASMGWDIVLLARDTSKLEAARSSCLKVASSTAQSVNCESLDITAYSSLPEEMDAIVARYGLPDLLVLSAGVMVWMARCFPELFSRYIELLLRWRFK